MKENLPILESKKEVKKEHKFERLLGILRKSIMVAMMGLATSQFSENRSGTYIGHAHETKIERLEKNKEFKQIKIDDIQRMVLQDESERIFLGSGDKLYEVAGGQKESGFVEFKDIQHIIDQGEKSPIVGHTHPISVYDNAGYTAKDIGEMKKENNLPAPMPPSITDIMGSINTAKHFDDQGVEMRERVYDPTGMWEYRVQIANAAIELFDEFQRDLSNTVEANLTDSDRQIMKELELDSIHPVKRVAFLKSNPKTSVIGVKLEQAVDTCLENLPEEKQEVFQRFGEIEVLCVDIAGAKKSGYDYQQIQNLIGDYIQTARAIGVQVSYQSTAK